MAVPIPLALIVIRTGMAIVAGALSIGFFFLRKADRDKEKDKEKK